MSNLKVGDAVKMGSQKGTVRDLHISTILVELTSGKLARWPLERVVKTEDR
jgi:hypothetical protein